MSNIFVAVLSFQRIEWLKNHTHQEVAQLSLMASTHQWCHNYSCSISMLVDVCIPSSRCHHWHVVTKAFYLIRDQQEMWMNTDERCTSHVFDLSRLMLSMQLICYCNLWVRWPKRWTTGIKDRIHFVADCWIVDSFAKPMAWAHVLHNLSIFVNRMSWGDEYGRKNASSSCFHHTLNHKNLLLRSWTTHHSPLTTQLSNPGDVWQNVRFRVGKSFCFRLSSQQLGQQWT